MKRRYAALTLGTLLLIGETLIATGGLARGDGPRCFGEPATIVRNDHPPDDENTIIGTNEKDVIMSRSGDDYIKGRGGNDLICAGKGGDVVNAGRGNDKVHTGTGSDDAYGGDGADTLLGREGSDHLFAHDSSPLKGKPDDNGNVLMGGLFSDKLYGERGHDEIHAGSGSDYVIGNGGRDELYGNKDNDELDALDSQGPGDLVDGGTHSNADTCYTDPNDEIWRCEL